MRIRGLLCTLLSISVATVVAEEPRTWLYLNSFQSGTLGVFDVAGAKLIHTIPVEDSAGSIGLAVTSDGEKVFVVDGDERYRLRIFSAGTGDQIAEVLFANRVLLLGGGPVIHLSADNHWLFVYTYDYASAASGVRVFDVRNTKFQPAGLRGPPCDAPLLKSLRSGSLLALCPNFLQALRPIPLSSNSFISGGPRVHTSVQEFADAAVAADGTLYALEYVKDSAPWRMVEWSDNQSTVIEHDLRKIVDVAQDAPGRGGLAWLDLSPDGRLLGLAHGPRIWVLERNGLRILHEIKMPSVVDQVAFTQDGGQLLSLKSQDGSDDGSEPSLIRISIPNGEERQMRLAGWKMRGGPTVFKAAQAPRTERSGGSERRLGQRRVER